MLSGSQDFRGLLRLPIFGSLADSRRLGGIRFCLWFSGLCGQDEVLDIDTGRAALPLFPALDEADLLQVCKQADCLDFTGVSRLVLIIGYWYSFATISIENGDDIKTVQANLGHHAAAFTLKTYAHVSDRMQQNSAARMEELISSLEAAE